MASIVALIAFPVALAAIALLLRSPLNRWLVSRPNGERWSKQTTPTLGGIGIYLGIVAGVLGAVAAGATPLSEELVGVLAGAGLLFLAGLADDLFTLPPLAKLGAQAGAAAIVLSTGLKVEIIDQPVVATALAMVWIVGMTNAFNLLDNMDGLAASLAAIASGLFAVDAVTAHPSHTVLVLALAIMAACAAFLPFNLRVNKPAAVFMGDSGSQLLGFSLACFGLASSWKGASTTVATLLLPILILAVPILDTTLVTLIRLLEGRPISQGGRDHTSHRLVYSGLTEKRAVVLLTVLSALLGATSLAYNVLDNPEVTLVGVLLTFAVLVQFASFLSAVERQRGELPEGGIMRSFVAYRRRLLEMLVDFLLISASFAIAYFMAVEGSGTPYQHYVAEISLAVILGFRYALFIPFGLYRGVWRYAGARDAAAIVAAIVLSELLAFAFIVATRPIGDFPRGIYVTDALICLVLVGASRFWERAVVRGMQSFGGRGSRKRTLIVGAGRGGRSLLRELRETPGEAIVGFVDDDAALRGRRLQGVPVLGALDDIDAVLARTSPDTVLVTIPDASRDRLDHVVTACSFAAVPCRFVRRQLDLDPHVVLGTTSE
jgi:UDP-GlcNAc:undecaprenyl-phosphate GlcNAc-1-phosphate transferase